MESSPQLRRRPPKEFIIDLNTTNISFIQTARDLRRQGVKNNLFFLKLYNKSLQGVDPFSPFLTPEQIYAIITECIVNPWYFLRECVRIPEQGGNGMPYLLNRANLAATFCFLMGIDHYLVIPRQKGKTQSTVAILDWAFLLGTTNSETMFINKKEEDANNNLDRLKKQRDLLPKYLQFKVAFDDDGKETKGADNVRSLTNANTGNKIVTKPQATSVEKAEGIGRGCSQPIQYYDEVEFTPHIKTIVEAAGPAFKKAAENARRNGAVYCRIFTSTPGDLDTAPGQEALKIINETCTWTEQFYDWTPDQIEEYIANNSGSRIVYIEYDYKQLGEDEVWFKEMCQTLLNNPAKIKREIFLKRMRGSIDSPFDEEDIESIQDLYGTLIVEEFINNTYKLNIYEELSRDKIYFVGVDVSNGYGQDNSAVTIVDPYTFKVVAEFQSPLIGVTDLRKFLYTLIKRHIPKGVLCIERNMNGEAILDELRQSDIRNNVYFDDTKDPLADGMVDHLDPDGFLKAVALRRKLYGVWTGGKNRDVMFALLERHMKEYKDRFVGKYVIGDILALVKKKNGRIEAGPGFHDDSIMSYLMVLYVWYHGKNLHRFGFIKGMPETENQNQGLGNEDLEEMSEEIQELFRNSVSKDPQEYTMNLIREMEQARRESQRLDSLLKPINSVQDLNAYGQGYDDEIEGSIDLSFFDELNS